MYCTSSHIIRHEDIQTENQSNTTQQWKQSRILYSQLLSNTETPSIPSQTGIDDIGLDLYNYLSYERSLGPHIWVQIKLSSPKIEERNYYENNEPQPQHEIIACGVLPLIYKENTT